MANTFFTGLVVGLACGVFMISCQINQSFWWQQPDFEQPFQHSGFPHFSGGFPSHWCEAPTQTQSMESVRLPGGYGWGSFALKQWIETWMWYDFVFTRNPNGPSWVVLANSDVDVTTEAIHVHLITTKRSDSCCVLDESECSRCVNPRCVHVLVTDNLVTSIGYNTVSVEEARAG